jgi:hypothetical protein
MLASRVSSEDAPSLLREIMAATERVECRREATIRYGMEQDFKSNQVWAYAEVEKARIGANRDIELAKISAQQSIALSRERMGENIVASIMSRALPREVNSIQITESHGGWFSNVDWQLSVKIS